MFQYGLTVIFYGLADYRLEEIIEFYSSREGAEEAVRQVLEDEPEWIGAIGVEAVDFGGDQAALLN